MFDDRRLFAASYFTDVDKRLRILVGEPGMLQNLICSTYSANSLVWIFLQKLVDKVSELLRMRYSHCIWNLVVLANNLRSFARRIPVVERQNSREHLVHNDTNCPPVCRIGMTFPFEKLRSEVGRSSDHLVGSLIVAQNSSHTKVSDLQICRIVQK